MILICNDNDDNILILINYLVCLNYYCRFLNYYSVVCTFLDGVKRKYLFLA